MFSSVSCECWRRRPDRLFECFWSTSRLLRSALSGMRFHSRTVWERMLARAARCGVPLLPQPDARPRRPLAETHPFSRCAPPIRTLSAPVHLIVSLQRLFIEHSLLQTVLYILIAVPFFLSSVSSGARAYCCQCKWVSVRAGTRPLAIAAARSDSGEALRWACAKRHSWQHFIFGRPHHSIKTDTS